MDLTQELTYFRNQMVEFFKSNPQGKYYKVVKWKTKYSPVLDVTPRVKLVIPNIKQALLTINGDNPLALSFTLSNTPFPPRTNSEIVDGWMQGYEIERMKAPNGMYAEVKFPCNLTITGGLPETYKVKWRGKKPYAWKHTLPTETGGAYATTGYDPIKNIIVGLLQIWQSVDWGYLYAEYNGKKYPLNKGVLQVNCEKPIKIPIKYYRRDNNTGYQQTITIQTITVQPNGKPLELKLIEYPPEIHGYVLEAWGSKPDPQYDHIPKYLWNFYDPNKSKEDMASVGLDWGVMYMPQNLTEEQKIGIKKVFGYDMYKYLHDKDEAYTIYNWVGLWPKNQQSSCSIKMYRDNMVKFFKQNPKSSTYKVIGWANQYSPILDVTNRVKQVYPNTLQATLTIYGNDLSKITTSTPYDTKPPAFTNQEIIQHWMNGVEIERAYCTLNKKWYYIYFPCKLEVKKGETTIQKNQPQPSNQNQSTTNQNQTITPQPSNQTTNQPTQDNEKKTILLLAGLTIPALLLLKKRRRVK